MTVIAGHSDLGFVYLAQDATHLPLQETLKRNHVKTWQIVTPNFTDIICVIYVIIDLCSSCMK